MTRKRSLRRVKALLFAAGVGRRLQPLTNDRPKCLVPVAGRPLLDFWIHRLAAAGVREALINTHSHAAQVRSYIEETNGRLGFRLTEANEPTLLGSAGTITRNAAFAEGAEQLLLVYTDNFSAVDLEELLRFHESHEDPLTMLLFRAAKPEACGIATLDGAGRVVDFVEKPTHPPSNLANAGVYVVDRAAYEEVAQMNAFDIGYDVLPRFVGRSRGWVCDGYHVDVGTHEAYQRVCEDAPRILAPLGYLADGKRPAVFLDRDGTLIRYVPFLTDLDRIELLPGAADAVRRIRLAGYACVVVSNQSVVGRGMMSEQRHKEITEEVCRLFAEQGVAFDALYHCSVAPSTSDRTVVEDEFRKPGPGMLRQAATELRLDLSTSCMVGDSVSDVLAGYNAGCRANFLLESGMPVTEGTRQVTRDHQGTVRKDLTAAVEQIVAWPPAHKRTAQETNEPTES